MDALTKEEREVVDWVRATSASKALKWSQEPGEWINRAELLLETVDRLCARLALAEKVVEAARKSVARWHNEWDPPEDDGGHASGNAPCSSLCNALAAYDKGA